MASHIYPAVRLTHRYRDAWSHLDAWGEPMKFKALAHRTIREPLDFDDGGVIGFTVIGDKRRDQLQQAEALREHFSGSRCRHEYDCCGCASHYASVRITGRGRFFVRVSTTFNY